MSKFQQWVRWFLGVSELPTKGHIAGLEKAERDRHAQVVEILNQLGSKIDLLSQQFQANHVVRRNEVPMYDWEQVQAQELAEMLANPPKESN